ncbi:MAG: DUF4062 domain-containing protein [Daejeonella sp.]
MKIFISSLIAGMETQRAAAHEAIELLGHEAVMAEDFEAKAFPPQIACLQGLRESGLVILILGNSYGVKQTNGLSATHQEYREAKERYPVLAFVQNGLIDDIEQTEFIKEVQGWEKGLFRDSFDTSDQLKRGIIRGIHEWQISITAAPLDFEKLSQAAMAAVETEQNGHHGTTRLILSIISGPFQAVLRPAEIEKPQLADDLLQAALFGKYKIFDTNTGSDKRIDSDSLVIHQEQGQRSIKLDPQGGLLFEFNVLDGSRSGLGIVVISEDLEKLIISILQYAAWVLDKIDPTQRLTHVSIAAGFTDSSHIIIRSRAENNDGTNSFSFGYSNNNNSQPVQLMPAHRSRSALSNDVEMITEDFLTLLKRNIS